MGTRGVFGFRIDQQDKLIYNHFDSYPDGLGQDVVAFAREVAKDIPHYRELAKALTAVDTSVPPDAALIERCRALGTIDLSVSRQSEQDYYCLFRNAQGDIPLSLKLGYYEDAGDFILDSLFCEYAYIINFDTEEIEFYEGFNKSPNGEGRYVAKQRDDEYVKSAGYYGVALKGEFPLTAIPDDWMNIFEEEEDD